MVGYVFIITLVVIYRFFLKRKKKKPETFKKVELVEKQKFFTFQEFLLSLVIFGLILNFYSLELNRLNTEKNMENYEVINRPYVFIRKINGKLDGTKRLLNCRVALVNNGSVPRLNNKIRGEVFYGSESAGSQDKPEYAAIYPESVVWSRFGFPIEPEVPVEIEYTVNYSDYRGYKYEYEVHFAYNWEFSSFTFQKSDETIVKP